MTENLRNYKFDELLTSLNITYIDREVVSMSYQEVHCDRCEHLLKYVNVLRIDETYYNIGDDCYVSIRAQLSKIRGISLVNLKRELEDNYESYLEIKYNNEDLETYRNDKINKHDPDYNTYLTFKWDAEHGGLPQFKMKEYEQLKEKFKE